MASNSLGKREHARKPAIKIRNYSQEGMRRVEEVQFSAEYDIPTLSDIADLNQAPRRPMQAPAKPVQNENGQVVNAGTIILSPELLRQITEEVRREVMRDVRQALRSSLSKAVCQTVGIATKDMRTRLQKELEMALPSMIEDTVYRRRGKR